MPWALIRMLVKGTISGVVRLHFAVEGGISLLTAQHKT